MGGIALQFLPSAASVEREARRRERQLREVPVEERSQWIQDRDREDGRSQAYVKLFGALLGGLGLAGVVVEGAYLSAHFRREHLVETKRYEFSEYAH
jgi:hypothetical protein